MIRSVYVCDRCGVEQVNPTIADGWDTLTFRATWSDNTYIPPLMLCEDCSVAVRTFATSGALVGESA